jgi:DNA (cytosine-5)-methyltransferase 1
MAVMPSKARPQVPRTKREREFTFASVYSGCGGLDLGFKQAGMRCTWANDIDAVAVATHNAALGHKAIAGDLDEVTWPEPLSCDLVIGGPPCQGFSVAGKMNPADPRSQHVWTFLDFVEYLQPCAFVMENVKALAVSHRWELLRHRLIQRSEAMGYRTNLHLLRASQYGVPQRRERMFLIGLRDANPPMEVPGGAEPVTVRQALSQLPAYGEPGNDTFCTARVTPARRPVMRPSPYRGSLLFNGNGRPLQIDSVAPTLPASMGGNATPIIDQRELDTGEESWIVWYHRRLASGGRPLKRVPAHIRRITVEEAAALQSFPIGMSWFGTVSARYRQIGNAVPPVLARHVADAVARSLDTISASAPLAAAG